MDKTMKLTDIFPLIADELLSMTEEDLKNLIRLNREPMLRDSDWTQLPDSPLTETKRAEWATYRQALRDITDTYADNLVEVEFPDVP